MDSSTEQECTKYYESKIIDMLRECGEDFQLYEDVDFPTKEISFDQINNSKLNGSNEEIKWYRPNEYAKKPEYFKSASPGECGIVSEGFINDSWFVGAALAIATHPNGLIDNLFVSEAQDFKKFGIFTCRFYKDGKWIEVATDTRIPFNGTFDVDNITEVAAQGATPTPLYSCMEDRNEVWLSFLEKAYAKYHGGFEKLHYGNVSEALIDFTGGSVKKIDLEDDYIEDSLEDDKLWNECTKYLKHHNILCCQLRNTNINLNVSENGIYKNHLYSIIYLKEIGSLKFIKLKNHWKKGNWKGDWGNDDAKWDENHQIEAAMRMDLECNFSRSGIDGTFWMIWQDFIDNFNELYIVRLYPEEKFHQYAVGGEWVGSSAAGPPCKFIGNRNSNYNLNQEEFNHLWNCIEKDEKKWIISDPTDINWFKNTQYRITVHEKTNIFISLLQRDCKLHDGDNFAINFLLIEQQHPKTIIWDFAHSQIVAEAHSYKNKNMILSANSNNGQIDENSTANNGNINFMDKQLPEREISMENIILQPKKSYVLVPYTDRPAVEMEFFLRIFSTKSIRMETLPTLYTETLSGSWQRNDQDTGFITAGGPLFKNLTSGPENPTWCQNAQYWLTLQTPNDVFTSMKIIVRRINTNSNTPTTTKSNHTITATSSIKNKMNKDFHKEKSQLVGLFVMKPECTQYLQKKKKSLKNSDTSKTNEMDNDTKSFTMENKISISPNEWCRISDYSNTHSSCLFLPKVNKEWIPDGLLIVPTLGEQGIEGNFDIDIYSDHPFKFMSLSSNYFQKKIEGEWTEKKANAGGCHLHPEWKKNPKFYVRLKTIRPTKIKITLIRSEKEWISKSKKDSVGCMIGFYLFYGTEKISREDNKIQYNGKPWNETDFLPLNEVSTPNDLILLPIFNDSYVIMPTTWEPKKYGSFILTITAECDFKLTKDEA